MTGMETLQTADAEKKPILHTKSRFEKPAVYPARFSVPDEKVDWSSGYDYRPPYFVAPVVLDNDRNEKKGGWADPEVFNPLKTHLSSFEGEIQFDKNGLPMNPRGRTGIAGRGLLGKWGANFAADPIVTRNNPNTGKLEMLAIKRKDTGEWAIPGGMVDFGEAAPRTLARELEEETGVSLNWNSARVVYQGYVDDPRNTDNAWMETTVAHLHLPDDVAHKLDARAGDDAVAVQWQEVSDEFLGKMYASHGQFVKKAIG